MKNYINERTFPLTFVEVPGYHYINEFKRNSKNQLIGDKNRNVQRKRSVI